MGMLTDNPCSKVTVPRGEKKEREVYTIEETQQLLELLETVTLKYKLFFNLLIYSGFRCGEMLGLEWKDIDYPNCMIYVQRTSNYTPEKGIYTDTTKSKKSERCLKFPQFIMDMLKDYQAEQNTEIERLGNKWIDHDRLFTKWNGEPMNTRTSYLWLKEFCEKNNFRFCDIHSFRHLNASLLINAGIDVTSVSANLGHAQVSTTLNIYSHYFKAAKTRASEAITNALNFKSVKI
jgi:integrase